MYLKTILFFITYVYHSKSIERSHDVRYTTRNITSFQIFHKTVRLKRCLVPFNMQTKDLMLCINTVMQSSHA